jgi:hypothetical protein
MVVVVPCGCDCGGDDGRLDGASVLLLFIVVVAVAVKVVVVRAERARSFGKEDLNDNQTFSQIYQSTIAPTL